MQRHAAFLRGVSPMNCKMPDLAHALREAGLTDALQALLDRDPFAGLPLPAGARVCAAA